jgi:SAM-dependent methyltransferase/uncharacterized protein YbaR (Trm112 family)
MNQYRKLPSRFSTEAGWKLWRKLRCPLCLQKRVDAGELLFNGSVAACARCSEEYPVVEGIPVLLHERAARRPECSAAPNPQRADPHQFYEVMFSVGDYSARDLSYHETRIRSLLAQYLSPQAAVLEVGCGRGQLQSLSETYLAEDYSLTALRRFTNCSALCASAECLPLADQAFDLIVTIACLEHIPCPELALAEFDRVLAVGGVLYLAPAWHCRPWASEGLPVRPFRDLNAKQKIGKLLLPLRDSIVWRGLRCIPRRAARRAHWRIVRAGKPVSLKYKRLTANYTTFWMSDSDATCSLDSHEGILYFESRGYECLSHRTAAERVLARHDAVIVLKRDFRSRAGGKWR